MNKKPLLLEIGCEELPTQSLQLLSSALTNALEQELRAANIAYTSSRMYSTPRRLAVLIEDLSDTQPAQEIERQGPSYSSAFDKNGTPTLACLGFASSCGVSTDQLIIKETPKGKRVFCQVKKPGVATLELLPNLIEKALKKLPIPKPMRWGAHSHSFVRPVHWIVMLYGRDIVTAELFGKKAGRETRGHRFHHPRPLQITDAKDYNTLLYSQAHVIAEYETRKKIIRKAIKQATVAQHSAIIHEELLDEVTALVEWPVALKGQFNKSFLSLPKEVLITSMETHIKCFPVVDQEHFLSSYFILISNIDSKNPRTVIRGYENVINARLADAAFFYKNDLKMPLEKRLDSLKKVVFQRSLGSMEEKSQRLSATATYIAKSIHADEKIAKRAGLLSKCDLVSEMVIEFPKLQGTMGYYYALNDKEDPACATAIKEQYLPKFSGDTLPESKEGAALALAERLDTLVGIFSLCKKPSGDKDPFGLRRATLGVLRILIEKELPVDLMTLLKKVSQQYQLQQKQIPDSTEEEVFSFFMSRLKAWYIEQGLAPEIFESVLVCKPTSILDFHRRIQAVKQFQMLPEASALAAANKRVSNILKKANQNIPSKPKKSLLEFDEEKLLARQLEGKTKTVDSLYKKAEYTQALTELSTLKDSVDAFFDQVMIMDKDKKKRDNRLALLSNLRHLFSCVADISLLP